MFRRADYLDLGIAGLFNLGACRAKSLGDVALFMNLSKKGGQFFFSSDALSSFRQSSIQNGKINPLVRSFAVSEWMDVLTRAMDLGLVSDDEANCAAIRFCEKSINKYRGNENLQRVAIDAVYKFLSR
jgi:hypothetical protein